MYKNLKFIFASVALAISLLACDKAPVDKENDTVASSPATKAAFKACIVSDQGGFDDKSFNESCKVGLNRAKDEFKIDVAFAESKGPEDYKKNVDSLIAQKCDLIIGVGFMLNNAIRDAAKANPNHKFALVDSRLTEQKGDEIKEVKLNNAKPLLFNTAEAAFLGGYLAAGMTKTGIIATFGGMSFPSVNIFRDGFAQGIEQYNVDNNKKVKLLGWDYDSQQGAAVGNFEDQSKAKQLTENFIATGADIILPVAGNAGLGTLSAVKSSDNVSVIWVDSDGYESTQSGNLILSSIIKKIDQSVYDLIKNTKDSSFSAEPYIGTIENNGVLLSPFHDFEDKVPAELKAKIAEYEVKIKQGEFKVETKNNP